MPNYIYPEPLAQKSQKRLSKRGYQQIDFDSFDAIAQALVEALNRAKVTLISCSFRLPGKYHTTWILEISTPGTCDIFQLLEAIIYAFDIPTMDGEFTHISTENKNIRLEFTCSC